MSSQLSTLYQIPFEKGLAYPSILHTRIHYRTSVIFRFNLDTSLPIGHPCGFLGDQFLVFDRRGKSQFDLMSWDRYFPFRGIERSAL